MWTRVVGWRFWLLVAVAVVDGLVVVIPIVATAAIVAAVFAPDWLRRTARFLDALADGDGTGGENGPLPRV